ncbi:MAG: PAS domain S-box protein [Deltaproteobacteria bacterium]|nr:PAS domain S-box protein [Deltaproteobacteria bacterium]
MRLKLTNRFAIYIGGILLAGILSLIVYDIYSSSVLLRDIGRNEAGEFLNTVSDELFTAMLSGKGRAGNLAVIDRFKKLPGVDDLRIIHGPSLDKQYGIEEGEIPVDAMDRKALEGTPAFGLEYRDGHKAARLVMPITMKEDCTGCHISHPGQVNGALSASISLGKFEGVIAGHTRKFIYWGGGILALTSIAALVLTRKRLLEPLDKLKEAALAIAAGDLGFRVGLKTGDEIEELGMAFDEMAESLSEATERLKYLNERHSRLVQSAADAIVLKDIGTKMIVEANPAAAVLTGYPVEELLDLPSERLYQPGRQEEYRAVFKRWVHDGKGYLHGGAIIKKDGFEVPIEIAASVLTLDGRPMMQEIWRDLTERKGFEDTIRRQVAELEGTVKERTLELNNSLKELGEAYGKLKESEQKLIESAKLVSLGEMGAGIAHELNSPIAGILSITEALIKRTAEDHPNRHLLMKVREAAVRSKYIIMDMLTYARPAKGAFAPMYLNETVKATLALFASEINVGAITIVADYDPALPEVFGNQGQMMQVILNIIKNARDAAGPGGTIFISTKTVRDGYGEFSAVEVRDTGPGIRDDVRDRIFDPFFTTKEKGGGLNIGLGLSIARSVVIEHGGRIEAFNGEGGGAVFRIHIPAYKKGLTGLS